MKLSAQEEYGLRCLLRVGRRHGRQPHDPELSRPEGISEPNVAKMMRVLREGGFVQSTRGQAGGYSLARPADQINVGEVLAAWAAALRHGLLRLALGHRAPLHAHARLLDPLGLAAPSAGDRLGPLDAESQGAAPGGGGDEYLGLLPRAAPALPFAPRLIDRFSVRCPLSATGRDPIEEDDQQRGDRSEQQRTRNQARPLRPFPCASPALISASVPQPTKYSGRGITAGILGSETLGT